MTGDLTAEEESGHTLMGCVPRCLASLCHPHVLCRSAGSQGPGRDGCLRRPVPHCPDR